jgi:hypothetical protein
MSSTPTPTPKPAQETSDLPLTTVLLIILVASIPIITILSLKLYRWLIARQVKNDEEQVQVEIPKRQHKTGEFDVLFRAYRDLSIMEDKTKA